MAVSVLRPTTQEIELAGAVARLAAMTVEHQRAVDLLATRGHQQAALASLGQHALAGAAPAALMESAVHLVAQSLDVEYAKVLEMLPDGSALILRAGVGWRVGLVGHATVGTNAQSQAGYTLQQGQPVVVTDLRTETRFAGTALLHDHGVVSGITVTVQGRARAIGVLGAHTARRRTFTTEDVTFLQAVANVLAEAIEQARAEEALRRSEERYKRIVETAQEGIWQLDAQLTTVFVNPAMAAMLAYTVEEMVGLPASTLVDGLNTPRWHGPGPAAERGQHRALRTCNCGARMAPCCGRSFLAGRSMTPTTRLPASWPW